MALVFAFLFMTICIALDILASRSDGVSKRLDKTMKNGRQKTPICKLHVFV